MPASCLPGPAVLLGCLLAGILSARGDEPAKTPGPNAAASVQQQLDELKEGQRRLMAEIQELRRLLEEKHARTDFAPRPAAPAITSVNVFGEPFRGTNTSQVAIIEYSDFECSFCGTYARNIFPKVDGDFIRTGKVRYFFRDLPEPNQTNAWLKARAARCAGDQGKFWEMHDRLFAAQEIPAGDLDALARTLGLDVERFDQCLLSEKYLQNIQLSVAGARRMRILGTPALLIGTISEDGGFVSVKKILLGVDKYETIESALKEALAKPAEPETSVPVK